MNDKARDAKMAGHLEAEQLYSPVSIVRLVQQNEPDIDPLTMPRLSIFNFALLNSLFHEHCGAFARQRILRFLIADFAGDHCPLPSNFVNDHPHVKSMEHFLCDGAGKTGYSARIARPFFQTIKLGHKFAQIMGRLRVKPRFGHR